MIAEGQANRPAEAAPQGATETSRCAGCGASLVETTRRPCERCGSINRVIAVRAADTLAASDKA